MRFRVFASYAAIYGLAIIAPQRAHALEIAFTDWSGGGGGGGYDFGGNDLGAAA